MSNGLPTISPENEIHHGLLAGFEKKRISDMIRLSNALNFWVNGERQIYSDHFNYIYGAVVGLTSMQLSTVNTIAETMVRIPVVGEVMREFLAVPAVNDVPFRNAIRQMQRLAIPLADSPRAPNLPSAEYIYALSWWKFDHTEPVSEPTPPPASAAFAQPVTDNQLATRAERRTIYSEGDEIYPYGRPETCADIPAVRAPSRSPNLVGPSPPMDLVEVVEQSRTLEQPTKRVKELAPKKAAPKPMMLNSTSESASESSTDQIAPALQIKKLKAGPAPKPVSESSFRSTITQHTKPSKRVPAGRIPKIKLNVNAGLVQNTAPRGPSFLPLTPATKETSSKAVVAESAPKDKKIAPRPVSKSPSQSTSDGNNKSVVADPAPKSRKGTRLKGVVDTRKYAGKKPQHYDVVDDGSIDYHPPELRVVDLSKRFMNFTCEKKDATGQVISIKAIRNEHDRLHLYTVNWHDPQYIKRLKAWRNQQLSRLFDEFKGDLPFSFKPLRWLQSEKAAVVTLIFSQSQTRSRVRWNELTNRYNEALAGANPRTIQLAGEAFIQVGDDDNTGFLAQDREAPWRLREDIERVASRWQEVKDMLAQAAARHVTSGVAPGQGLDDEDDDGTTDDDNEVSIPDAMKPIGARRKKRKPAASNSTSKAPTGASSGDRKGKRKQTEVKYEEDEETEAEEDIEEVEPPRKRQRREQPATPSEDKKGKGKGKRKQSDLEYDDGSQGKDDFAAPPKRQRRQTRRSRRQQLFI